MPWGFRISSFFSAAIFLIYISAIAVVLLITALQILGSALRFLWAGIGMPQANRAPAPRGLIVYNRRLAAGASAAEEPGANSAPARRGLIPCKRRLAAGASAAEEPGTDSAPARRGLIPCKRRLAARASATEEPGANSAPARRSLIPCNKQNAAGASAAEEPRSNSPPWASLQEDMLRLVAGCLLAGDNDVVDYLCFRAVCVRWRSSTACLRGRGIIDPRFHPRHWMMLPEGYGLHPGHPNLHGWVRFINLRTGAIARIRLPLFQDHSVLDSVDGLLLIHRNHDLAARLLHPFTGDIVDLPSLATILPHLTLTAHPNPLECAYLVTGVSATAVNVRPDGVIAAVLAFGGDIRHVAFATSEDQRWSLSSWETLYRSSAMSFQGKLYFVAHILPTSKVFMIDPTLQERVDSRGSSLQASSSLQPPMLVATFPQNELKVRGPFHLVEHNSEILLVGITCFDNLPSHNIIYRLDDIIMGRFVPVKCLGGSALFLSIGKSICVSSKTHPTIVGDSTTCRKFSNGRLGTYHLKSDTWSIATDGRGPAPCGPIPSPYTLIHHIFTCCLLRYWKRGQIYHERTDEITNRGAKKKRRRRA